MKQKGTTYVLLVAVVGAALVGASACIVRVRPAPVAATATVVSPQVVATPQYTPMYYNGHVVYYDNGGAPIYYVNGGVQYVPRTYHGYNGYTTHYRTYRPHYNTWYSSHGHRYRGHRVRVTAQPRVHPRRVVHPAPRRARPVRRAPPPPTVYR